jgi:tetratricopeptide (TPR) repeat protein
VIDKKRWEAYLNLVNALLNCASGQEPEILNTNIDLIDIGLLEAIQKVIDRLTQEGKEKAASWLQNFAAQLADTEKSLSTQVNLKAEAYQLYQRGNKQYQDGHLEDVIQLWQQALKIYQEIRAYSGEAEILGNLGCVYHDLGNYDKAIEYYEQSLTIARALQYRQVEGALLNNIGFSLHALENDAKAIEYYEQGLSTAKQTHDHQLEIKALENLRIAYRYRGNEIKAIECCLQILTIMQELKNRLGEGVAFYNLGTSYETLKDYDKAIENFQQSLIIGREVQDRQLEGVSVYCLGSVLQILGNDVQAIEYYKQSLSIGREIQHREIEVKTLNNIGLAYNSLGNAIQALDYLQQGLNIAREIPDRELEGKALDNLGLAYNDLGDYDKALECHQKSLAIERERQDRKGEAMSLNNLGLDMVDFGNFGKAIEYYEQSLTIAREIEDRKLEATVLNNLGTVYRALGNQVKAIEYYEQSLKIDREIKNREGEGKVLGNLGNIYRSFGNYEQAIDYHQQCLAIARERQDAEEEMAALNNLGLDYDDLKDYERALACHEQELTIAQEIKNLQGEAKALGSLGNIYYRLKDYDKAIDYHYQCLTIVQSIQDLEEESATLNNIGAFLLEVGNFVVAESILFRAIQVEESIRKNLNGNDANKISIFDEQAHTYRLLQEVLIAQSKIENALEIAERGRARSFVELLAERLSPQLAELSNINPISIQQIKQLAKDYNVTFVEYSIIYDSGEESNIFIWVIKPTAKIAFCKVDIKHLKQQNTSLSDLVNQTREYIGISKFQHQTYNTESLETFTNHDQASIKLRQLYQLLIHPIAHLLSSDPSIPLFFIPQQTLFLIPFPALQDAEGKFLIEKYTIVTAPSIQILELTQKRSVQVPESSLKALVVGNPKMPAIPLTEPPVELKNLAWAKTEAQAIASLLNTQAITGADATKAHITQLLPKAQLIHLATHGLLDDVRQLGIPGAVALAPSDDDNGFLTAGEIYDMKLNAELFVLSACSTGQGKITGDGVIGLSRCLIAAGVKSVIVSLWSVEDLSTALLMVKFYQILRQGVAASVALSEAQRWLLRVTKRELEDWVKTNERFFNATLKMNLRRRLHQLDDNAKLFCNPRYWAAFCAIGQG